MTLHKGKGLEFPHVFLPGWDATSFPSAYGDHDEERRLAYVALTRGMQRVSISYVEYRRGFTRPSCFIDDIPIDNRVVGWLYEPDGAPIVAPRAPRQALRELRSVKGMSAWRERP